MARPIDLSVSLPPIPESAVRARRTIQAALANLIDPTTIEDAELLVTELVTNAVRHAALRPGDTIGVRVRSGDDSLCIEVSDPGIGFEQARSEPHPDHQGGFGLFLLDRMSTSWGVANPPTRVWFELPSPRHPQRT